MRFFTLWATLAGASALLANNNGEGVWIPDKPVEAYGRDTTQPLNVLVVSLLGGSHKRTMDHHATDLSKTKWADSGEPMFNVTVLTSLDSKLLSKASSTLHPIALNYTKRAMKPGAGRPNFGYLIATYKTNMD